MPVSAAGMTTLGKRKDLMEQGRQYGKARWFQRGNWGGQGRIDSLSYAVVMVTVVLLGFVWWQTVTRAERESQQAIEAAQDSHQNMAYLAAGQFTHLLDRLGRLRVPAEAMLDGKPGAAMPMESALAGDPALIGLAIFERNAALRYQSAGAAPNQKLASWVAQQLNRGDGFSRPAVLPPATDGFQMTVLLPIRRGGRPAAEVLGALLVKVDLSYFFGFLQRIEFGKSGELSVLSEDGIELMRARRGGLLAPRLGLTPAPLLAGSVSGVTRFGVIDDQYERRLFALAKVGDGGLQVAVSRLQSDVTALSAQAHLRYLVWAVLASLLAAAATYALVRLMRRQGEVLVALARTEHENKHLIRQIDEEKNRAYQLAYYDQLTGLANRTFFRAMSLDRLVGSRRRRKASAIMFIDLDRFKAVNDTHGHRAGDQLLIEVGRRLRGALRESDLVSRFGGDEFVIQVDDLDTVAHLDVLAAKVIEVVGQAFLLADGEVEVLPSIGIAVCPQDGETVDQLITH